MALMTPLLFAEDAAPRSRASRALLESFPYRPSPPPTVPKEQIPIPESTETNDSDVIVLPQLDVHSLSPRTERSLDRAVERSQMFAPVDTTRVGTGVRERDFGKVRATARTILYVPVALKFSW